MQSRFASPAAVARSRTSETMAGETSTTRDVPEPAGGRERELPGARAEVHHGGGPVQAVRLERGQVGGRVRIALLAVVARHEGRAQVFRPGVGQLVDHPWLRHEAIVRPAW